MVVLVGLYEEPERPPNAVDYIKRYMGAPTGVDVEALRAENEQLKVDKAALENTIRDLNAKVFDFLYAFIFRIPHIITFVLVASINCRVMLPWNRTNFQYILFTSFEFKELQFVILLILI